MKIVINSCFGGYGLSKEAYDFMGLEWDGYGSKFDHDRTNTKLVECVESLGVGANGFCARLTVVDIPDGIEYEIDEYDGLESVHEAHRSWC